MGQTWIFAVNERRKVQRHRVLKGGTIAIDHTRGIDCTVRNLSDAGACLGVAGPLGVPEDFILELEAGKIQRPCHVVWRAEKRIGVAFK